MAEIIGQIDNGWAKRLSPNYRIVDAFNFPQNQNLWRKITFSNLGGLSLRFYAFDGVFAPKQSDEQFSELEYLIRTRGIINLSFAPPGWVTLTSELLTAATQQRTPDDTLTKQLTQRMTQPEISGYAPVDAQVDLHLRHATDEVWLLPKIAVVAYRDAL